MKTNLEHKKEQVRNYVDFYGFKIHLESEIENAQSFEDLDNIIVEYSRFLEYQLCDALHHLESFRQSLFLEQKQYHETEHYEK